VQRYAKLSIWVAHDVVVLANQFVATKAADVDEGVIGVLRSVRDTMYLPFGKGISTCVSGRLFFIFTLVDC
jgi:hypothetical protein